MATPKSKTILVTGDFIVDHHVYEGRRHHFADAKSPGVTVCEALGGAGLLHQLFWRDKTSGSPAGPLLLPSGWISRLAIERPSVVDQGQQAFAFWRPRPGGKGQSFWRVAEAMGFGTAQQGPPCCTWPPTSDLPKEPDILVLSDGGMGFRKFRDCWARLPFARSKWIVYKTEAPDFAGDLWKKLAAYQKKLVVVISASELRKTSARISSGLSWESTLQDLYREVTVGTLAPLGRSCAHLVISFGVEGAIWIDWASKPAADFPLARFVFDAPVVEGERRSEINGTAFGLMSCLTAGVVWSLTASLDRSTAPDLIEGFEGGLSAMRDLLERGHGSADEDSDPPCGFPAGRLADVIRSPRHLFSRTMFLWNKQIAAPEWSLLRQAVPDMLARARLVAMHGDIVLQNVPHLAIGNLFTADRHEIECLRTLVQTIRRYQDRSEQGKKPLSIGVFGPPGSGKSFAVEEIANHFFGKNAWLVFNLSQFKDEGDLIGAFHQIRDRALQGIIPVAFFDEFDSQNLRWLQYLLAPMQDGRFQEGQVTHPIGKCVFVFAGGTSFTARTFVPAHDRRTGAETEAERHFRLAKGTDFSSRLDATLDVLGPNARPRLLPRPPAKFDPAKHTRSGTYFFEEDPGDDYRVIRRARMLRSELKVPADGRMEIDSGLLEALLVVPRYTHGSRSLAKIVQTLRSGSISSVRPSALPPIVQLGMHVNPDIFLAHMKHSKPGVNPHKLTKGQIEAMAAAIHETYREVGRRNRWLKREDDKDFKDMREPTDMHAPIFDDAAVQGWKKQSNREAAVRMPQLLALAGLRLDTGKTISFEKTLQVRVQIESLLELLARMEHTGWMDWHFCYGWKFGKVRKDEEKVHDQLLPYNKLNDENKNKDRSQVRHFPEFASDAGMKVVAVR